MTNAWPCYLLRIALVVGSTLALYPGPGLANEPNLSISGYEPVAYVTDGRPVPGSPAFEYVWHNLRWRFASNEHREMFAGNPLRYAPEHDGYCAMGRSGG